MRLSIVARVLVILALILTLFFLSSNHVDFVYTGF